MNTPSLFSMVPAAALLIYVVIAPDLVSHDGLNSYDTRRILELIVLLLGCSSVGLCSPLRNALSRAISHSAGSTIAGCAVALGFGLVSSATSTFPEEALLDVAILVALALTAIGCSHWATNHLRRFRMLAAAAIALGAAISITQFIVSFVAAVVAPGELQELFPSYLTPRFFSQWQTWTLPLIGLPLLMLPEPGLVLRSALRAVIGCWWVMAFLSGGRGTLLSLALACACLVAAGGPPAARWLRGQAQAPFLGAVTAGVLFAAFPAALEQSSTFHRLVGGGDSGRWDVWKSAIEIIVEHPILGVGPLHYAYVAAEPVAHPHNAVLQFAAEWGLPAATAIVFLAVFALRKVFRALATTPQEPDHTTRSVRYALTLSAFAAALHANLSGLLIMPLSQCGACLVAAWLAAELRAVPTRSAASGTETDVVARDSGLLGRIGAVSLPLGTFIVLTAAAAPAIEQRISHPIDRRAVDGLRFRPRIWREGQTNFSVTPAQEPTDNALHE